MVLRLAEMTWPEVETELASGTRLALVMAASTEQHGNGLPLAVDAIRGDELGERIADELGCFLAPTIRPGLSAHHMGFPGTITLSEETFQGILTDYCRSLDAHGIEHIALVTTHGGNADALDAAADRLDDQLDAHVFVAGDRDSFMQVRYDALNAHGVEDYEAGKHAGAAEASFIMETHPELVRRDDLARGYVGDVDTADIIERGFDEITDSGILGDQTLASRAAGRTLIDACTDYYVDAIREEVDGY